MGALFKTVQRLVEEESISSANMLPSDLKSAVLWNGTPWLV